MEKKKFNLNEFLLNYALYIILGLMIIVVIIIEPGFLHPSNFIKILTQASTRGILALGVAGMIVLAGTDLSAGRILGCCAAVSASLVQATTYASRMYPEITKDLPLILPLACKYSDRCCVLCAQWIWCCKIKLACIYRQLRYTDNRIWCNMYLY